MKIKKLKVTENLRRFISIPLVGLVMATSFSGCSGKTKPTEIVAENYDEKEFSIGEHIISIEIDDPTLEKIQYEYHKGYKAVGISTEAHGQYSYNFGKAHMLYVNEYPVKCRPTYQRDEEMLYTDFGTPVDYVEKETKSSHDWKEFNVGEHIISIPLEESYIDNFQITSHDGYEPIGIATSSYGKYSNISGGGCILYTNTQKVKCLKDDDSDNYTSFGIPVEDTKSLQK